MLQQLNVVLLPHCCYRALYPAACVPLPASPAPQADGHPLSPLQVATLQKFRKGMPPKSSVMVAKNTLMRVACKDRPKWSTVAEKGCKGENAWVFVDEDEIADVIKHYFKFESALFDDVKKQAPKGVTPERPTELRVAVMDSKYLSTEELKKCENLPNKKQLYGQIAGMLTQPTRKIATGVKMVPTKLAIAIKKLAELDEDKTKTVAVAAAAKASAQPSA